MNYIKRLQEKVSKYEAEIADYERKQGLASYDPNKNPEAISLIKQADGNWIGETQRFGKVVSVRQGDPQIVLQMLLTHDGR